MQEVRSLMSACDTYMLTSHLDRWKTYKNTKGGGITSTLRKHLKNKHGTLYEQVCRMLVSQGKLKPSAAAATTSNSESQTHANARPRDKFTHEGFLLRLMRWIVADDQVRLPLLAFGILLSSPYISPSMSSSVRSFRTCCCTSAPTSMRTTFRIARRSRP